MMRRFFWALILTAGMACNLEISLRGEEPETILGKVGDRQVQMQLTGSAIRTKGIFKVYSIDSYVEQGLKIHTAQEMIDADQPKQMHIIMLRTVLGPDMADAFTSIICANHPEPKFEEEINTVAKILGDQTARKGEEIWFTHIPKVGFQCKSTTGVSHLIRNVEFSKAVWENYFGKNNVGDKIKLALLSKLPKE